MGYSNDRHAFKRHGLARVLVGMATALLWWIPLSMGETAAARAVELTIDAVDSGTLGYGHIDSAELKQAFVGPIWASRDENGTGPCTDDISHCVATEYRNYFKFDLSLVSGVVIGAQLVLEYPAGAHDVPPSDWSDTEDFQLYEITSDPNTFGFDFGSNTIRPFVKGIYDDLGDGQVYGLRSYRASDEGGLTTIDLNQAAVAAINAARGGMFSLGGVNRGHEGFGNILVGNAPSHRIFANTGFIETDPWFGFLTVRRLVLTVDAGPPPDCYPPPRGDVIDDAVSSLLFPAVQCPGYAASIWADVDQDMIMDTQVVFYTLTGEAYATYDPHGSGKRYFYTFIDADCGGVYPFTDRGRLKIRFVDMLVPGFVWDNPATWTFRGIASVSITTYHDRTDNGAANPYQSVQAYRNINQTDPISGTESPLGGAWTQYDFSDPAGIMELFVSTDFAENVLDDLILMAHNTPCGSGVVIPIVDHTIAFDTVTDQGDTTITENSVGTWPPVNFEQACSPPQYFEISTTATYSGNIEICLSYDGTTCGETALTLFHNEGGAWVDVTSSLDTVNDIICGTVTELSEFLLAKPSLTSSTFTVPWYMIACGGVMFDTDVGGMFELSGTIAQFVASWPTSGGSFELISGFWFGQPPGDCVFDGVVDLLDFSRFAQCEAGPDVTTMDSCRCQDTDSDGDVDLRDFGGFQVGFSGQ